MPNILNYVKRKYSHLLYNGHALNNNIYSFINLKIKQNYLFMLANFYSTRLISYKISK